jgi:hypothetical protein
MTECPVWAGVSGRDLTGPFPPQRICAPFRPFGWPSRFPESCQSAQLAAMSTTGWVSDRQVLGLNEGKRTVAVLPVILLLGELCIRSELRTEPNPALQSVQCVFYRREIDPEPGASAIRLCPALEGAAELTRQCHDNLHAQPPGSRRVEAFR